MQPWLKEGWGGFRRQSAHVFGCAEQPLLSPCLGSCPKTCRIGVQAVADLLSRLGGVCMGWHKRDGRVAVGGKFQQPGMAGGGVIRSLAVAFV